MQNAIDDSIIDTAFAVVCAKLRLEEYKEQLKAAADGKAAPAPAAPAKRSSTGGVSNPFEKIANTFAGKELDCATRIQLLKGALDLPIVRDLLHSAFFVARQFSPEAQEALQKMYATILPCAMSEYQLLRNREFGIVRDSARPGELMTVTMCR